MNVLEFIQSQEGCELKAYKDSKDLWTIGWGRCIETKGIEVTQEQADAWLADDLKDAFDAARRILANFDAFDEVRKAVVVSMIHQLGPDGFEGFENTIGYLRAFDFEMAAVEMLDSKWARIDTPARAQRQSEMMRSGKWPT